MAIPPQWVDYVEDLYDLGWVSRRQRDLAIRRANIGACNSGNGDALSHLETICGRRFGSPVEPIREPAPMRWSNVLRVLRARLRARAR